MCYSLSETFMSCDRTKCGLLETAPEKRLRSSYWESTRFTLHVLSLLLHVLPILTIIRPTVSIPTHCRMAPSSSDAAPTRAPGSRTLWPCSTSRRSTMFPSASWRRCRVTPLEKRAKRMKRWGKKEGEANHKWGSGEDFWEVVFMNGFLSLFHCIVRFSATLMRWFPIISTTSCSSLTARARPSTGRTSPTLHTLKHWGPLQFGTGIWLHN